MNEVRILLSEEDFKTLVTGGVVRRDGVTIALKDIGHFLMHTIVMDAAVGITPPADPRIQ